MRIAYFDCFSGASGDMILGSLLDAGLDIDLLRNELGKLHLSHYDIQAERILSRGLRGTRALVLIDQEHHQLHHRHLRHIREILHQSDLDKQVKDRALGIFVRLAEAEAAVHRKEIEEIHFHEVGAMDAIIDVVGAVAGLNALGVERIYCSPVHVGSGTVECAHGTLPVPAPATAELIKGREVYATSVKGELLTPTGAAILTELTQQFGAMPRMAPDAIGYGAGRADLPIPNLLRVFIGEERDEGAAAHGAGMAVMETTIDDMNPQIYEYLFQKVGQAGAQDAFLAPVQMKKNRPGVLMTLICPVDRVESLARIVMTETTTIGVRWRVDRTIKAEVSVEQVEAAFGKARVKIARIGQRVIHITPEYEDCKQLALQHRVALKRIMDQVREAAWRAFVPGVDPGARIDV